MRRIDGATRFAIRAVIERHRDTLAAIPGFVSAEPGFPVVDVRERHR